MEQVTHNRLDAFRNTPTRGQFFFKHGADVSGSAWAQLKLFSELQRGLLLRQVRNTDQTQESYLECVVAPVDAFIEVCSQRRDSLFNLQVEPAQRHAWQDYEAGQLFVYAFGERFDREASHVSLHVAEEGRQGFAFDTHDETNRN